MNFEVIFYKDKNGKDVVSEFLDSLDNKMASKIIALLDVLEEKGTSLRLPYSKHLEGDIFELRCKVGNNIARLLYFFHKGQIIIVTNGFVKKTQKTLRAEIKLAKARRKEWLAKQEKKS